ncbi:response regulator [Stieleria varia]|uniref:Transcriptional regulatory protein SrrA n=1 Tax=Stieleria varia TaxID=2528005 RepID=A0A5C6A291_9BACT|nr:response regulator [Stieleria varia]TWT93984.1 Transcriptional regulatory protein SrrA [Stieleria varia]
MSNSPAILIIEDDPVFRRVLSFTLSKAGFAVETASDGEKGYERLMRGGIDFLVTDYQMPICSGLQLLERLDNVPGYKRPNAILCTAKGLELDGEALRNRFRLTAILHKPFSPRKLSELVVDALASSQEEGVAETTAPIAPPVNTSPVNTPFGPPLSIDASTETPTLGVE